MLQSDITVSMMRHGMAWPGLEWHGMANRMHVQSHKQLVRDANCVSNKWNGCSPGDQIELGDPSRAPYLFTLLLDLLPALLDIQDASLPLSGLTLFLLQPLNLTLPLCLQKENSVLRFQQSQNPHLAFSKACSLCRTKHLLFQIWRIRLLEGSIFKFSA